MRNDYRLVPVLPVYRGRGVGPRGEIKLPIRALAALLVLVHAAHQPSQFVPHLSDTPWVFVEDVCKPLSGRILHHRPSQGGLLRRGRRGLILAGRKLLVPRVLPKLALVVFLVLAVSLSELSLLLMEGLDTLTDRRGLFRTRRGNHGRVQRGSFGPTLLQLDPTAVPYGSRTSGQSSHPDVVWGAHDRRAGLAY